MARVSACPDRATLSRLLLGWLPADEAQRWEEHLAGCGDCLAAVASLPESDTLLEAFQGQTERADEANPDPAVEELISRLCLQPPPSPEPITVPGSEEIDFLAPPRAAGEIGWFGTYR